MHDRILSSTRRPGASARQRPPGMAPLDWQAQREWTSLHERLRPEPARPDPADSYKEEAQAAPASPPLQAEALAQAGWTAREWLMAAGLLLVALLLVKFAWVQHDGVQRSELSERIDHLAVQQDRDRAQATERATRQEQRYATFVRQTQTLVHPPTAWQHGRELMAAGRWADAEAAFGPMLFSGIPDALRADVLLQSAQANAMSGNCGLMAARLTALQRIAPREPVLRQRDELMRRCTADRRHRSMAMAGAG